MNKEKNKIDIEAFVISVIISSIILPFIYYGLGYVIGFIAKVGIGEILASSLNIAFNVDYFTPKVIPHISAAISWFCYNFSFCDKLAKSYQTLVK